MFCTNCGAADQAGNFCRECGADVRTGAPSKPRRSATVNSMLKQPGEVIGNVKPISSYNDIATPRHMTFGEAVSTCFKKYGTFAGRATRTEYWFWQLFCAMAYFGAILLGILLGGGGEAAGTVAGVLFYAVMLAILVPSIAVEVRRFHDTGKSGANYWWRLLPIIGSIIIFVYVLQYSEEFDNEYGNAPA